MQIRALMRLTALAVSVSLFAPAFATTLTWSGLGGDNKWGTPKNWAATAEDAGAVPANGDTLVFPASAYQETVNDLKGLTLTKISFTGAGAQRLSGNAFTLQQGSGASDYAWQSSTGVITNDCDIVLAAGEQKFYLAAQRVMQNGVVSGEGKLVRVGSQNHASALTLCAANTYTGGTRIDQGILEIRNDYALGATNTEVYCSIQTKNLGINNMCTLLVATDNVYNPIRVAEGTDTSSWGGNTFAGCQVLSHRGNVHYWNKIYGGNFCATFSGPDLVTRRYPSDPSKTELTIVAVGSSVGNHYFHGTFDTTGLKFYTGSEVHLYGAVTNRLAGFNGCSYSFVPQIYLYSPANRFNGTTGLWMDRMRIFLKADHVADDFGALDMGAERDAVIYLNNHPMGVTNFKSHQNRSNSNHLMSGGTGGNSAVLTMEGRGNCLTYPLLHENLSLVWNPTNDYTLTISSNRTSTMRGPIVVKRGTVSLENAHSMQYLDEIIVETNATFNLATTGAGALSRLHFVRVAANGRFTVAAGSGAAFTSGLTEFYLEKGAKIVLASGATLSPRCVVYDGQGVAGDTYETAEWLEGEGSVTVPVQKANSRLPAYVATSSKGYFNAAVRADKTMRVAMSYRTDNTDNDKFFFGVRDSGCFFGCSRRASGTTEQFNPELGGYQFGLRSLYTPNIAARRSIDYSIDGFYVNGRCHIWGYELKGLATRMLSDYELKIAGYSSSSAMQDNYLPCEIYGFTVWRGGRLVRQFIPAVDEDGVACLYDGVSKTLFYKAGGTVTAAAADSTEAKVVNGEIRYCVTVSCADDGLVSVNGGGLSTSTNVWASITDTLTLTAAATNGSSRVFSRWEGSAAYVAGGPAVASSTVSPVVPGSLTVLFGCRNKDDPTDTRPHGYMIRTQNDGKGTSTWTDGDWSTHPDWWLNGYIPDHPEDVAHFTDYYDINLYPHWWIDFPSGDRYMDTIITAIKPKMNLNNGWNAYMYINDQTQMLGRWQHENSSIGGFGTTDENTPVVVNRAWSRSILGLNVAKADHEMTVTELSGNGMLRKVGLGRFNLTQPFLGGLKLEQGTVRLGMENAEEGYDPTVFARYDAGTTDKFTFTADPLGTNRITKWVEAEGRKDSSSKVLNLNGPYYHSDSRRTFYGPTLGTKTVNGVKLVDYGAYTVLTNGGTSITADSKAPGEREAFGCGGGLNSSSYQSSSVKAIFLAYEYPSKTGNTTPIAYWGATGGFSPNASGVRLTPGDDVSQFTGRHWINGAPTKSEWNQNCEYHDGHAFSVYATSVTNGYHFWHSGMSVGDATCGGIRAAEMLVYTNTLTDAQCSRTSRYLQKKWHDRAVNDIYPWTLDYLYVTPTDGTANLEVADGKTAAIRTVHRPVWSELAGKALVKTGGGTLELDRVSTNLDVVVKGGKVKFIRETAKIAAEPEAAPHALIWCDASKKSSFIFQEGSESNIVAWCDWRTTSKEMLTNWVSTARWATLNTNGLHGLPCVDFGTTCDSMGPRLGLASDSNPAEGKAIGGTWKTQIVDAFIVWRNIAPANKNPVIFHDPCATSLERMTSSLGTGPKSGSWTMSGEPSFFSGARWSVDGRFMHPVEEFPNSYGRSDYVVIRCRATSPTYMNQLGGKQKTNEGGGVQVAEFIGYPYPLSDFAARQTEAYLMKKWKGAAHPDESSTLDAVNSVKFDGAAAELDVASDRAFGTVSGSGTLVKKGAGAVTVGTAKGFGKVSVAGGALTVTSGLESIDELTVTIDDAAGIAGKLTSGGQLTLAEGGKVNLVYTGAKKPPYGTYVVAEAAELVGGEDWTVVFDHPKSKRVQLVLRKSGNKLVLEIRKTGYVMIVR